MEASWRRAHKDAVRKFYFRSLHTTAPARRQSCLRIWRAEDEPEEVVVANEQTTFNNGLQHAKKVKKKLSR